MCSPLRTSARAGTIGDLRHARESLLVGVAVTAFAPAVWAGPFPVPIIRDSDVSIQARNTSGGPANDWHVRIEDPNDQPVIGTITISPPNPGTSIGIGTKFEDPNNPVDLDAYMDIFFGVNIPNNATVTIAWDMPDSNWKIEQWYFTNGGAQIGSTGPGFSIRPDLNDFGTEIGVTLGNPMDDFERDAHGAGVSGSIIVSDVGYRLSATPLALSDLSFTNLIGLGLTPIPGTGMLPMGAEQLLPGIPVAGSSYLQFAVRVQWDGDPASESLVAVQFLVELPCPQDVNGDGNVNVLDLVDLLLCFGLPADPPCNTTDVNGDGTINVLDLIDLLLAFGTSCP